MLFRLGCGTRQQAFLFAPQTMACQGVCHAQTDFLGLRVAVLLDCMEVLLLLGFLVQKVHQHRAAFEQGSEVGFDSLESGWHPLAVEYVLPHGNNFVAQGQEEVGIFVSFALGLVSFHEGKECACLSDALSLRNVAVLRACLGLLASTA